MVAPKGASRSLAVALLALLAASPVPAAAGPGVRLDLAQGPVLIGLDVAARLEVSVPAGAALSIEGDLQAGTLRLAPVPLDRLDPRIYPPEGPEPEVNCYAYSAGGPQYAGYQWLQSLYNIAGAPSLLGCGSAPEIVTHRIVRFVFNTAGTGKSVLAMQNFEPGWEGLFKITCSALASLNAGDPNTNEYDCSIQRNGWSPYVWYRWGAWIEHQRPVGVTSARVQYLDY